MFLLTTHPLPTLALLLATLGGCAHGASTVSPIQRGPALGDDSVVIGRLGLQGRRGSRLLDGEVYLVSTTNQETWKFGFALSEDDPDTNSTPFFINLPPDIYRITRLRMLFSYSEWTADNLDVFIEVPAGQIVCVGAIYNVVAHPTEDMNRYMTRLKVVDECDDLSERLIRHAPFLRQPTVILLAQPPSVAPARSTPRPPQQI